MYRHTLSYFLRFSIISVFPFRFCKHISVSDFNLYYVLLLMASVPLRCLPVNSVVGLLHPQLR